MNKEVKEKYHDTFRLGYAKLEDKYMLFMEILQEHLDDYEFGFPSQVVYKHLSNYYLKDIQFTEMAQDANLYLESGTKKVRIWVMRVDIYPKVLEKNNLTMEELSQNIQASLGVKNGE